MTAITLQESDSGKTVEARAGDHVELHLPENPSTGFRWVASERSTLPLNRASLTSNADPSAAGAGGTRFLHSEPLPAGEFYVALSLRRGSQPAAASAKTFELNLKITP
ncbi:MAG: protease inhibitor I42 family protein [Pseudomonadota bacterium]|nr:protease inhibitor I42 family protein [Pseudomonadota bacterium]